MTLALALAGARTCAAQEAAHGAPAQSDPYAPLVQTLRDGAKRLPPGKVLVRLFPDLEGTIGPDAKRIRLRLVQDLIRGGGVDLVAPRIADLTFEDVKAKNAQGTELDWDKELMRRLNIVGVVSGTLLPAARGIEVSAQLTDLRSGALLAMQTIALGGGAAAESAALSAVLTARGPDTPPDEPEPAPPVPAAAPAAQAQGEEFVPIEEELVPDANGLLPLPEFDENERTPPPSEPDPAIAGRSPAERRRDQSLERRRAREEDRRREDRDREEREDARRRKDKRSLDLRTRRQWEGAGESILERERVWTVYAGMSGSTFADAKVQGNTVTENLGTLDSGAGMLLGGRMTTWRGPHQGLGIDVFATRTQSEAQTKNIVAASGKFFGSAIPSGTSRLDLAEGRIKMTTLGLGADLMFRSYGGDMQVYLGVGPVLLFNLVSSDVLSEGGSVTQVAPKISLGVRSKVAEGYGFMMEARYRFQGVEVDMTDSSVPETFKTSFDQRTVEFALGFEF